MSADLADDMTNKKRKIDCHENAPVVQVKKITQTDLGGFCVTVSCCYCLKDHHHGPGCDILQTEFLMILATGCPIALLSTLLEAILGITFQRRHGRQQDAKLLESPNWANDCIHIETLWLVDAIWD